MVEKNDAATVEVTDEGVVTVDVSDNPDLAKVGAEAGAAGDEEVDVTPEPKPEKKPVPRVRIDEQALVKPKPVDEATAALTQAVKTAEEARKAAEATALAERQRADAAAARAQQHEQTAKTVQEAAEATELALLTSGIDNATRELAAYQDELQRALEAGEFPKVAQAQVKVSKAASTLDRLEAAKADYEAGNRKTAVRNEAPIIQQPEVSVFERYVSGFSPVAQSWLRQHPECVPATVGGNATKNAAMMKGHYAALEQLGAAAEGSPEYFRVIEEAVGYRSPVSAAAQTKPAGEQEEEAETPPPPPARKKAQPSAPVSREPPNAQGQVPRTTRSVTLSKEQQEAAKLSWPNLPVQQAFAQYARNLLELEAEGKIGRLTH